MLTPYAWTPHSVYDALGKSTAERAAAYRSLFTAHFDQVTVDQVRRASQTGMALGSDIFKDEIEKLSGRRMRPLMRGPKIKAQKDESF